MTAVMFLLAVAAAGLGGYALLLRVGLDDFDAWAGGRIAGLVLVAMPAWWLAVVGTLLDDFIGFGGVLAVGWRVTGGLFLVAAAAWGGLTLWQRRQGWRELLKAELIFSVGALLVLLIRLDHPHIAGQEKPMDVGIFATLLRAEGFPPPDMWLAGWNFPYYYWGALIWIVPIAVSGLPLEYAYNLVVALICGAVAVSLWALGRRLAGSHLGGLAAAFFGLCAGSPDGLRQLIGGVPLGALNIWRSSRQHEDVITEFPLFTAWLGDLHPHLLSMPIACLAFLVAWRAGRGRPNFGHAAVLALLFGVAWAANPWAMPPTLAGVALLVLTADGRWHWPVAGGLRRWAVIAAVAVGGWLVAAPFHLDFVPFFQGIKPVFAWTHPVNLMLYGGCLLLPAFGAALTVIRGWGGSDEARRRALTALTGAAVMLAAAVSLRPSLVFLAAAMAVLAAWMIGGGDRPERPAVALAVLGLFLFLVPELLYIVDNYGERLHRMNTVFKAYIQAWTVLALALPVLVRMAARSLPSRAVLVTVIVVAALPHLGWAIRTQFNARVHGLDGFNLMAAGDQAIVRYLRRQPAGVWLIEAEGGAYTDYARISANSGVPALMGWENHESVWHTDEDDIFAVTGPRKQVINELYRSGDPARVRELVAEARRLVAERGELPGESGIVYVVLGSIEHNDFPAAGLAAIRDAGEVVLEEEGGALVRFEVDVAPAAQVSAAAPSGE